MRIPDDQSAGRPTWADVRGWLDGDDDLESAALQWFKDAGIESTNDVELDNGRDEGMADDGQG